MRFRVHIARTLVLVASASVLLGPAPAVGQQVGHARSAFRAPPSERTRTPFVLPEAEPAQRGRSRTGRFLLQFLASSAGAAGTGLVGYLLFEDVGTRRVKGDAGYTRPSNVAYLTGSWAGATLGAHLVGRRMGGQSPLWATATGALVGTVPLFAIGGVDEPYLPIFGVLFGWIPQGALATIGFTAADSSR